MSSIIAGFTKNFYTRGINKQKKPGNKGGKLTIYKNRNYKIK
jgi:hypothetical protein